MGHFKELARDRFFNRKGTENKILRCLISLSDYAEYTEYCHNNQNEKTIADTTANSKKNEEIDSNSGYEEYNDIKVTTNNRYQKTADKNNSIWEPKLKQVHHVSINFFKYFSDPKKGPPSIT